MEKCTVLLWIEKITIVIMVILPKAISVFGAIPVKTAITFFTHLEQVILNLSLEAKMSPNSQNNLEKELSWRYHATWLQTMLQSYSNQNSVVLGGKDVNQWHRIKNPEMNWHLYAQLIHYKESKLYAGKGQPHQHKMLGKLYNYIQNNQTGLLLHYIQNQLKRIKILM